MARNYSLLDVAILGFDRALAIAFDARVTSKSPDDKVKEQTLSENEKTESSQMMRINHSGEVCAQALYMGQAIFAEDKSILEHLLTAADEEQAHLDWCSKRLEELDSRPSLLNPPLYLGSYAIGAFAAKFGDSVSLGFIAETENQVAKHLERHLKKLSPRDTKSRRIVEQMRLDEMRHESDAIRKGGKRLSPPIKMMMKFTSKLMTGTTKYI